ncbi:hypothetical protein P4159_05655 [Bacillus thuringiensis]|uniref:hypothetical protein n=1 Tax=Bacillus cereus group TaxID=86661 RepID=UPI001558F2B7|nr:MULTISPECIES: hypothetical protein [Bacillus cereus group]MEC3420664.1 hypothetical protein [Bacillus cereus]MEC3596923.1 hypothetical protein [Bacillus thuringiensis]MED1574272.1 hypothetical protein [Bacillus paranthracis]MED1836196.1 hypothetical protein [Bacillus thuringiensis]MED2670259.1 hypothetical protein [Bacillus thuringiensis]
MFETLFLSFIIGIIAIAVVLILFVIAEDILPLLIIVTSATFLGFLILQAFKLIS